MTARRPAGLALGLLVALVSTVSTVSLLAVSVAPAQAAGYRYWSFWEHDGSRNAWTYATSGPSQTKPSDGDVQGFRFAVSEDSKDAKQPRGAADFDAVCSDTSAKSGQKRIALVIDPGTAADAPSGETPPKPRTACAQVDEDATSADALASVAKPLRYDSSAMLCAISGYPKSGCGEQVSSSNPSKPASQDSGSDSASDSDSDSDSDSGGGPSVGLIAGVAVVAVLGVAAVVQARRRRG
ncbi:MULTISPECIES: SCO2322 family protein [unclassified Streptomyces]|uniref:SCO2322 family protein n=1 Tax=unclassified Streptomyces TaxID=2593676 RepID=UPI00278C56E4|nr:MULTISPECIES: SCO2322 family protein [unclassified Streptomyces]